MYGSEAMFLWLLATAAGGRGRDDATLLRRIAAGDQGSLRTLYERAAPVALAVAVRILGSRGEAEEAVQDAFVQAWQRAETYDERRGPAVGWVTSIVRSRALDRLRARASLGRTAQAMSDAGALAGGPAQMESVEGRQRRLRVHEALCQLPEEQRASLELAYFAGLTQKEIAESTAVPIGTVKTRCRLALQKLASILEEEGS